MLNDTTAAGAYRSNNSKSLDQCADLIRDYWGRAKTDAKATLENMRLIGEVLNEAKDTLAGTSKGAFGEWCDAQGFAFDKSWRARLMKLAANWDDIMQCVQAAPEGDRKTWSLDGVLGLWRAATKAAEGPGEDGEGSGDGEGSSSSSEPKETKAQKLERMLREALERIAALEAENAKLKGGKKAGASFDERDFGEKHNHKKAGTVNAATRARAKSVWNLYQRPGTPSEGEAAKGRLEAMAAKLGMSFDDFVAACGLKK